MTRTSQEIWKDIYVQFEDEFGRLFLKDDNKKKKAHVDNGDEETSNALIHEPQLKWSLVLFLDGMVQIATNNSFTSKQQSCVDRRQFNHHTYLKKCIDDVLGHTASNSISKTVAKVTPEMDERCSVLPARSTSSSAKSVMNRVTPELEERSVIAPPAILTSTLTQARAYGSTQAKSKSSTQALASSFFSSMGMNSERNESMCSIPPTVFSSCAESSTSSDESVVPTMPRKKIRKKNESKNHKTTYRAWLDNWDSFEKLADSIDVYSGGGKSATRHATLARVLIHKLSMISTADINVVVPDGPRSATWQEVFDYVLHHPGHTAPVSLRTARKSLAEARRLQLLGGDPFPPSFFLTIFHH